MKVAKIVVLYTIASILLLGSYPQDMWVTSRCKKNTVDISIVDKIYSEKNQLLNVDVIIPLVKDSSNEIEQNRFNKEVIVYTENWIKTVKREVEELFSNGVPPNSPYELYSRYTITKLKDVISFYIDYYQFTGGAHGITVRKAYTVDNNFKELTLEDLFNKGYHYKAVIDKKIREEIAKEPEKYFTGKEGFNGIDKNTKFYVKDNYLVIYYGQYEIAPYVAGIPEFYINTKDFGDSFKLN